MVWIASLVFLAGILQTTAAPDSTTESSQNKGPCRPYAYCDGVKIIDPTVLNMKTIHCDSVPVPKDRCCLPNSKHLICYHIMVSGGFLSIDRDRSHQSTDFEELCHDLVKKLGYKPGNLSAISVATGESSTIYRNHAWQELSTDARSGERIDDLACSIED